MWTWMPSSRCSTDAQGLWRTEAIPAGLPVRASVRLLGVTVSGLSSVEVVPPDAGQMNLLEEAVDLR
ncbi:hypothetical protein [Acidithiobacillus ferriphilus]|uniref:hypothetical protein n=1 Tax=Acidithiobacillus ferriphilus TaxID=1689834 RepID=UPI002DB5C4DB|nr:hypothetical protein [Acidithiobacillus ferriphilus]MEB8475434.1 hypothetical protein [Acidithiobacillus ferriphilus]